MDKAPTSRRGFLRSSTAAAGAAVAAQWLRFDASHVALAEGHGKKTRPIRLGGPVFNMPQDPEEMALAHRKLGYRAAYCPGVGLNEKERIRDISAAFAKHDVAIAEVGRWVNLLDADPAKRAAMNDIVTLLLGALRAEGRVLIKLNVSHKNLAQVLEVVPSMKSPTGSPLNEGGYAIETVVEKSKVNTLIPLLKARGATDILELPISKIVP